MDNYLTKTTRNLKWVGFSLLYFFQIIISVIFLLFHNDFKLLLFLIVIINIVGLIVIVVLNSAFNKALKKYVIEQKNDYLRIFQALEMVAQVLPNFLNSLKSMGNILFEDKEKERFSKLDKVMEDFLVLTYQFSESYSKLFDKNLETDQIKEIFNKTEILNESILSLGMETKNQIANFNERLIEFKSLYNKMVNNNAKMLYEFGISAEILSAISTESSQFSYNTVKEIFVEFEKISNKSRESAKFTEDTMNSFINENTNQGLSYILNETKFFLNKFNDLEIIISNLKLVSDSFMQKTLVSLKEIQDIAINIQNIAEKIKLISINVRIEAAHLDNKKSGFQVLGNEINEFADLTSKIITNANYEIDKTIKDITSIKTVYESKINEVVRFIPELQSTIKPFEEIINTSFNKIKNIITELYNTSNNITNSLNFIIDKFQYQDITSQENKNIISYINKLSENFSKITKELNIESNLSKMEKDEVKHLILTNFNSIITTQKERIIIENFAKEFGIDLNQKCDNEKTKDFKKIDDTIILF
ncbi:MAG: hypothetical protein A2Y34_05220 [Spirochaetes bacterium GWC1_27_15]|nr:MAG: hypothetical protein A2Y34_05220 [Spirochaetes bacterium GWC1_27_15]